MNLSCPRFTKHCRTLEKTKTLFGNNNLFWLMKKAILYFDIAFATTLNRFSLRFSNKQIMFKVSNKETTMMSWVPLKVTTSIPEQGHIMLTLNTYWAHWSNFFIYNFISNNLIELVTWWKIPAKFLLRRFTILGFTFNCSLISDWIPNLWKFLKI